MYITDIITDINSLSEKLSQTFKVNLYKFINNYSLFISNLYKIMITTCIN